MNLILEETKVILEAYNWFNIFECYIVELIYFFLLELIVASSFYHIPLCIETTVMNEIS